MVNNTGLRGSPTQHLSSLQSSADLTTEEREALDTFLTAELATSEQITGQAYIPPHRIRVKDDDHRYRNQ